MCDSFSFVSSAPIYKYHLILRLIYETLCKQMALDVVILETCKKELKKFPQEILEDFLDAVARLKEGIVLNMPLSKQMPSIGKNVHELRFKDKSGAYRVFYIIKKRDAIYAIHAFKKKTQKTPQKNIDIAKTRIGRL